MNDLTRLAQLAEQHALSYASPHHFCLSVAGLRSIIEAARTTPPPAPVLSDAEIDAIGFEQWGNQIGAMKASYRAYARAIEQAIGRASRGAK